MNQITGIIDTGDKKIFAETEKGTTASAVLQKYHTSFYAPCGGNGTCGKCRIRIRGEISEPSERELAFLSEEDRKNGIRLACMCRLLGHFEIMPTDMKMQVQLHSKTVSYTHAPMLTMEKHENETVFFSDGKERFREKDVKNNLGIAVDIGTTTVAAYLCDMEKGEILATRGIKNPQSIYGADVISRMDKIMKDESLLSVQQKLICNVIRESAQRMCEEKGLCENEIRAAVICGNTVMQHIAAGINPVSIGVAPFHAPTLFGEEYSAHALGLLSNPNAIAYFAPCFASYVGGDIACGMIATGLDGCKEKVLFVDIGTNGEIGLSTENGLYFCSAAAGPAFEGAHIACGMPGIPGAVGKVFLREGKIGYETVGAEPAIGICGSGVIDAVAVMLQAGLLDETGLIAEKDEAGDFEDYMDEDEDENPVFMIDKEKNIYICAKDIREIQLAKAAVCAGAQTLLHTAGIEAEELSRVIIAGGFGSHLRAESLCRIGMLPITDSKKLEFVGNAAGMGAVCVLLGKEPREAAKTVCGKSEYTELSGSQYFMEKYIDEMMFSEENGEEIENG
ncbi:MAG: DUF4445 domain-containing protein [Ruminococcaceae bacterium]|nr:DUF4445 domain-containing protein [Oscillospiraceae bacterium]